MGMFGRFLKTEERALEKSLAPVSADDFLNIMGWGDVLKADEIIRMCDGPPRGASPLWHLG